MWYLAKELTNLGHQAQIFAPSSRTHADSDGTTFHRLGTPIAIPVNDSVARITLSFRLANQVQSIVQRERFDVLHFHEPLMPAKPMTLLRLSTTANVGTFHAFSRSNAGYHYGRPFLRPYLERLHRGIAVSEPARAFFSRYFPDFPLRIIPNGIDTSVYRPGLRGGAESFISRHRLPDVVMAGFVPDFVLPRYYDSADIFCAPATGRESFGIVLLEAMACALPVVATEVPGYMSVLEPGTDSLTVRPKSWAELGAALVILARDPELRRRMGAAGFEKAKQYSWSSVASQVIEVYEEARAAARGLMESHVHDAV